MSKYSPFYMIEHRHFYDKRICFNTVYYGVGVAVLVGVRPLTTARIATL